MKRTGLAIIMVSSALLAALGACASDVSYNQKQAQEEKLKACKTIRDEDLRARCIISVNPKEVDGTNE